MQNNSLQTRCCMGGIILWLVAALFACWAGYSTRGPGWSVGHHLDLHTRLVTCESILRPASKTFGAPPEVLRVVRHTVGGYDHFQGLHTAWPLDRANDGLP